MLALAQWLEHTSVSQEIQKALWLIPLLQTTHIIAIATALSSVLMIELRILGFGRSLTMTQTSARYAPWLWTGLTLLAVTGLALIIGEPSTTLADLLTPPLVANPFRQCGHRCGGSRAKSARMALRTAGKVG